MVRIVLSLTTLPSRVERNLERTLDSVRKQSIKPDAIYLNVPRFCDREGRGYDLSKVKHVLEGINVLTDIPDDGPITKLLPVLDVEKNPNTYIILIDDDTIYHTDMIKNLLKYANLRAVGISARNYRVENKTVKDLPYYTCPNIPVKVSLIETVSGVLYKRNCFPNTSQEFRDFIKTLPEGSKFVDDIVMGAWLDKKRINRWMVPCVGNMWQHDHSAPFALSQTGNLSWRNVAVFDQLYKKGFYKYAPKNVITITPLMLSIIISLSIFSGISVVSGVWLITYTAIEQNNKH